MRPVDEPGLDHGDPQGSRVLRQALCASFTAEQGLSLPIESLLLTRDASQALQLAAQALFRPGSRVAVEAYGHRPAWDALRSAGVELVSIGVDEDGLKVEALAELPHLDGVYVTPHHQYPTGARLSAGRRDALLRLARDRRFPILEHAIDHEFHWHGPPAAPLASRDPDGVVVYFGGLPESFAPDAPVGWISAPDDAIQRMMHLGHRVASREDRAVQQALAARIDDGDLQRHVQRLREVYRECRSVLLDCIATNLPDLVPTDPPGGLGIWCQAPGIDVEAWRHHAQRVEMVLDTAKQFRVDGATEAAVSLGFAAHDPDALRERVGRLARALAEQRVRFPIRPSWSVREPGSSCDTVRFTTASGNRIQKTYRSDRAFRQARGALERVDPDRVLAVGDRSLLLRHLPGLTGSLDPAAHHAAGAWLRNFQRPFDDDDLSLEQAFAKRIEATQRAVSPYGIDLDLDPGRFAGQRVFCHRDFRPANWVWNPPDLEVIDFEHARPDHPLVDLVKLATEIWPENPPLEHAFLDAYGPVDRFVLDGLIRLHGANTLAWGERYGDAAFIDLGRRVLGCT